MKKRNSFKRIAALIMTCVVMMTAVPAYGAENMGVAANSESYSMDVEMMLYITNLIRGEFGATPLTILPQMQSLAGIRQAELSQSFGHTRPNGQDYSSVLDEGWIVRSCDGENIINGVTDPIEAASLWSESEEALARMGNPSFTHVGIGDGTADGNWVQLYIGDCEPTGLSVDWDPEIKWVLEKGYMIDDYLLGLNVECEHGVGYTHITESMCSGYDPELTGVEQEVTVTYGRHSIKIRVEFYEPMQFEDVKEGDWYYDSVSYVYAGGIMTGLTSTRFGAAEPLYRAQFASLLHRMQGTPEFTPTKTFPDIAGDEWYATPVLWAASEGIINGYGNGNFGPNDVITREQIAAMLYSYAQYLGLDVSGKADIHTYFDGSKVSDYAREAMAWAVHSGIISGKNGGALLDPWNTATRAECAAMVQSFMEWGLLS